MLTRRQLLRTAARPGAGLAFLPMSKRAARAGVLVNDIHSQLNPTQVERVVTVDSEAALRTAIFMARRQANSVCIAGGRHAMGGQQFAAGGVLLDTTPMRRIVALDAERGIVEVEAGLQWPELVDGLIALQQGRERTWSIIQKQTGADRLSIGGALSANIHGRGLALRPFIGRRGILHPDGR